MEFGLQFFPSAAPSEQSAQQYWGDALHLVSLCDALDQETMETQIDKGAAWVGDPAAIRDAIAAYVELVGDFEMASLQVNFNTIAVDDTERSMRLFADAVMPHITV